MSFYYGVIYFLYKQVQIKSLYKWHSLHFLGSQRCLLFRGFDESNGLLLSVEWLETSRISGKVISFMLLFWKFSLANCNADTCARNGILKKGKYLQSSTGRYELKLQESGNLEIFCQNISIWESKTTNDNADFLYFDQHGKLVIFGKDDSILWSAGIGQNAEKLVMQDDGNVVLYKDDGRSVWATGTNDKCHSDKG